MVGLPGSPDGHSSFRGLAALSSVLFMALACLWMLSPARVLALWGVQSNDVAELVSRRGAATYAGFSVMFFMARTASPSTARRALVSGLIVTCLILAVVGLVEIVAGRAHLGILVAVFIEVGLVLAFLFVDRGRGLAGRTE